MNPKIDLKEGKFLTKKIRQRLSGKPSDKWYKRIMFFTKPLKRGISNTGLYFVKVRKNHKCITCKKSILKGDKVFCRIINNSSWFPAVFYYGIHFCSFECLKSFIKNLKQAPLDEEWIDFHDPRSEEDKMLEQSKIEKQFEKEYSKWKLN